MPATNPTTHFFFEAKPLWTGTVGSGGVTDASVTTVPLTAATNLDNGDAYVFTLGRVDQNGDRQSVSLREVCIGTLSGTSFINCVRGVEGTAQAHGAGTVVEILFTATHWNKMIEGIEAEHNQDGTHKAAMITSLTAETTVADGDTIMIYDASASALRKMTKSNFIAGVSATQVNDSNGNEAVKTIATASAVNELTVTNAATGNAPQIAASGDDTNIDLKLAGKGTGKVKNDSWYGGITTDTDGATVTFNMATSNDHKVVLGGNRTLAVSNVSVGQKFLIELTQDATGSRTVTWFSGITWAAGTTPTLTTTANKSDIFVFRCTGSGAYQGLIGGQNI